MSVTARESNANVYLFIIFFRDWNFLKNNLESSEYFSRVSKMYVVDVGCPSFFQVRRSTVYLSGVTSVFLPTF